MSLQRVVLRDFVIVAELDLALQTGFTALTGETGAGKSILIDALQLVTGGRADVQLIREGALRTDVSAEFEAHSAARAWLEEAGFPPDDAVLLRRTVDLQGKSRAWINGSPATATQLRALGEILLDIHGQHAWQSLTRAGSMRALLDAYARADTQEVSQSWKAWQEARSALDQAQASQEDVQRERDRLAWQVSELEKLSPAAQEWEQLNAEHTRLSHAQALLDACHEAVSLLYDRETSSCGQVGQAMELLQKTKHIEPMFHEPVTALASALAQMEDVTRSLKAYARRTDLDPQRLSQLDDRMSLWISLSRRFKRTPEELPALLNACRGQLQALVAATDLDTLQVDASRTWEAFLLAAQRLTHLREMAATRLADSISRAMQELGMSGGRFEVQVTRSDQPMQTGLDEVQFLVAGHAGSTPRPVSKVASGGELSRLALAIAVTTSRLGAAQTLIFDEVDAGVGGAVADAVGRLMLQLGGDRQVLAVTHLPQVAACANHHLLVSKQMVDGRTLSAVTPLSGADRVAELARMLGGERIMASTLTHAKDMLLAQEAAGVA